MAGPHRAVRIEADGGSRGNPGPAAFGAVLFDADTGEVIADRAERIGVATNNVAEYRGLIAGLELYREHADGAALEVRMDSKLVVEQMAGRWKIKHPGMRAARAAGPGARAAGHRLRLDPAGAQHLRRPDPQRGAGRQAGRPRRWSRASPERPARRRRPPPTSAARTPGTPTTLLLVRHGVTAHTVDKRFSGGLAGSNPGLNDDGRAQARATADWLAPLAEDVDVLVSSPVRRTRETAEIIAERLGMTVAEEPGLAEMEFGAWEGKTFAEVREEHPDDLDAWLGSMDHPPGGGESFTAGAGAGPRGARPAAGAAPRPDRARGQPRHPDQGAGRPRAAARRWSRSTGWSWRPRR